VAWFIGTVCSVFRVRALYGAPSSKQYQQDLAQWFEEAKNAEKEFKIARQQKDMKVSRIAAAREKSKNKSKSNFADTVKMMVTKGEEKRVDCQTVFWTKLKKFLNFTSNDFTREEKESKTKEFW